MRFGLSLTFGFILAITATPAFASDSALTRAEFTKALVEHVYPADLHRNCEQDMASSLPPRFNVYFADVGVDTAYAQEICLGMLFGLVDGNRSGMFRPHERINIAEASKMIAIAYGISLPDSTRIKHLGWHWRFTESLKRRGVHARDFDAFGASVSRTDMQAMLSALRTAKPKIIMSEQSDAVPAEVVQPSQPSVASPARTKRVSPQAIRNQVQFNKTVGNYRMRLLEKWHKSPSESQ